MPTAASITGQQLKVCFNSNCKNVINDHSTTNGWRCRSGDFAQLCHPCATAYVEGRFCETFHSNVPGWRCCETCGKQIHCGCIVSFHMFVLLDAGGIECLLCTRKSFILQPNPAWPQPSLFLPSYPEGIKDFPAKNWSSIAGSGPVPWRQAPNLFNGSSIMTERQVKASSEIDVPGSNYIRLADKQSACSFKFERNDNSVGRLLSGSSIGWSCDLEKANPVVVREVQNNAFLHGSHHANSSKNDPSFQSTDVASVYTSVNETGNANNIAATTRRFPTMSTSFVEKKCSQKGLDTSTNLKVCGGNVKGDGRGRSHLLTQYSSCITDQLRQNSEVNYVITPLFEKTLSASDAGRIGRLVLPKKCAEAYLPKISHPEGLPLEVQDVKGNQWVFQFRFWPNNNSRMYVLEGITPWIQALQLHAGDTVTFGRLEPEGKLVMGGRKASISSTSDQGNGAITIGGSISAKGENKIKEETTTKRSKRDEADAISGRPAISGSGLITTGRVEANTVNHIKRKGSTLASKSKHARIDSMDLVELKLTCRQAQGLFRPPPDAVPKIVVIQGFEFEEYEAAPVIGRPTLHSSDDRGKDILWAQCEDCLKWRKRPSSTLLPCRWTCSANLWDPMRSVCSVPQELMGRQLEDFLSTIGNASISKTIPTKQDLKPVRPLEGLDTLANLAIRDEEGASLEITRHPQHTSDCTCIVCMQSSSGKVSENKKPCDSITSDLMNKQQLVKDAETAAKKPGHHSNVDLCSEAGTFRPELNVPTSGGLCDNSYGKEICASSAEAGIDLNNQPKRVEEFASSSNSDSPINLLASHPVQCEALPDTDQAELAGILSSCKIVEGSSQRSDVAVVANTIASTSTTQ